MSKSAQAPREAPARTPLDSDGPQVFVATEIPRSQQPGRDRSLGRPAHTPTPRSSGSAGKPVTLQFWLGFDEPSFNTALKAAIGTFERQHPNIRIQTTYLPTTALREKLLPLLTEGGAVIDIIMDTPRSPARTPRCPTAS